MDKQVDVLNNIINIFSVLEKSLDIRETVIKSDRSITEVYYLNKSFAIQLEIVWRECDLFVFLVTLDDGKIPSNNYYYSFADGKRCRIYIEEALSFKNDLYIKKKKIRYTKDFLYEKASYYVEKITNNQEKLKQIL